MATLFTYILYFYCMTVYEIICPISNGSVWVGITKNVELRFTQHMWGTYRDSSEKSKWCAELKQKKLIPILNIIEDNIDFDSAKKKEKLYIIDRIKKGNNLFNVNDRKLIHQYDTNGELVGVFFTTRQAKKETGILPKMKGLTSGGYVWTYGDFDSSKLDTLKTSRQVLCKKVKQISKSGEVVNTFDGVREACRLTGIDHRSISQVAAGSVIRKSAGGFKWQYV